MAIVQISKIQQRSGNLVDLPQLDDAEFGWASDEKRLFIGKSTPNENIEVLTSYSNISFSQINGSDGGNFNISNAQNGQILTYVSSTDTWENYTGNTSQLNGTKLQLGNVSNIYMSGGAIGYVLETDGTGNLSWTPKNSLYTVIRNLTNQLSGSDNIITMTVPNNTPYTNGQYITISNANVTNSSANSNINGQSFYIKLNGDYANSGQVVLYTDPSLSIYANGLGLLTYDANSGVATATLGGSGGGGNVGGSNTTVLFNNQNISDGDTDFTWNFGASTKVLTVNGNANVGNLNATGTVTGSRLVSNIATGTAPVTVTSTTLVPNLYVARANVSDNEVVTAQTTGTFYPVFVSATSGNLPLGANANISFNAATGNLTTTLLNVVSNATVGNLNTPGLVSASQVSANSNGSGTNFKVGDDAFIGDINITNTVVLKGQQDGANGYIIFGNGDTTSTLGRAGTGPLTYNGAFTVVGNANVGNIGAAAGVFTGTLSVTGNANVGNLGTAQVLATANVTAPQLISNVASGTAPFIVTSPTKVANLNADYLDGYNTSTTSAVNSVVVRDASASFSANVITANSFLGNIDTAAQPNITSVGTLTSLAVTGNVIAGNVYANSGTIGANLLTGTLTTAAQPNITSLGTLTGLTSNGVVNFTGASNVSLGAVGNLHITGGSANQILKTDGSGNVSWGDPTGGYYLHTQTSANTTWTVVHNLNRQYVSVEPIDSNGNSYVGRYDFPTINYTNANALTMTFSTAVAGWAAVVGGGLNLGNVSGNYAPSGVNTQVQFNDAGNMAGSSGLVYNKTTGTLTATLYAGSGANLTNIAGANVTGTVANATYATTSGSATTAGTVTTAAQPNITSIGTLTSLVVTGNISGANLAGTITTAAQPNITSVGTLTSLAVTGNISGANLTGTHYGAATGLTSIPGGNVTGQVGNALVAGTVYTNAQPNITSVGTLTGLTVGGHIIPSANVTYDLGNATNAFRDLYLSGNTIKLGNAGATISANATAVVITSPGGNAVPMKPGGANSQVQYNDNGIFGGSNGMVWSEGTTTLTVNNFVVTSTANLSSTTLTVKNITTGANTTQGNITGNWVLTAGSKMQATYADLAEYYEADQDYEPGTVLEFGGDKEVTLAQDGTTRVAGVVSTNPAYAMNANCQGIAVAIALQGRVPTKVRGKVSKGDMMVSAGNGYARPWNNPQMGTVIGKALENFEGIEGVIEIAVGRL